MTPSARLAASALAAIACLLLAVPAQAAPRLTLGFFDQDHLFGPSAATNAAWFARAKSVNAQMIRINVVWSSVAPERPPSATEAANPGWKGYRWGTTDAAVRSSSSQGLRVLLTFTAAPAWAEGARRPSRVRAGTWRPSAAALRAFATAAARRYSGTFSDPASGAVLPRVKSWQAWNEPNLSIYLSPQWIRRGGRWRAASPSVYRGLLNAVYAGIRSGQPRPTIVSAGTAPYGDPPGGTRMRPVEFTREFLCLHGRKLTRARCPNPAHFDVLAHHPYAIGSPYRHAISRGDAAVPDLGRLTRVLRAARRSGRALPNRPKPLWITEISWDSNPPDPQGVPINRHAQWLQESFYLLWKQGARVILWLGIADYPPMPAYDDTYQAGVFFADGRPKPAATAFRFPLAGAVLKTPLFSLGAQSPTWINGRDRAS